MTNKSGQLWRVKLNARDLGRLIWCAVGAAAGTGIALWFVDVSSSPFLLASIGGSTMFLFGLTRAPYLVRLDMGGNFHIQCFEKYK
jgi:hypothetical protein